MKHAPAFAALLLCLLVLPACHTHPKCEACPAMQDNESVYRHVVAFKFKDSATDAQVQAIVDAFGELQNDIDAIIGYEHGLNVSPEGLDQGYTHVFIVTFKGKAGLEEYLPHPAHQAFVENLLPLLEGKPFVVDFVAE
ncbi:MAG: Dabb family protein [Phycisphaeraceae bacterium]